MKHEFLTWCDERTAKCMNMQRELAADGRGDEACFMQIRANVYGIFRSVFTALKGDLPALQERLTSIPSAWVHSLEKAEEYGETEKAHIERIKLETANEIRHYVSSLEAMTHD